MVSSHRQILRVSIALAKVDFKLKNEGSYLGILWYLLDPILMFIILIAIRDIFRQGIDDYPLYLLIVLVVFNFFRKATNSAIKSISSNQNQRLIKSLIIDKKIFVLSSFFESLYSHFFEFIVLIGFMIFFQMNILNIIFYPVIMLFLGLFILGVSFVLTTIGVYVKDMANIWGVLTRLLWFATPIFYSAKVDLPFNFNAINPMYYFITIARQVIVYSTLPDFSMVMVTIVISLMAFVIGLFVFKKQEGKFAEMV